MPYEMRWFFQGAAKPEIISWFQGGEFGAVLPETEERTDVYLRSLDNGLGIKLREGKLEIKWRRKAEPFTAMGVHVRGKLEDWEKWSWRDSQGKSDRIIQDMIKQKKDNCWLEVKKLRMQRKYEHVGDRISEVGMTVRPSRGCMAELTTLGIMGVPWWTMALDLFGTEQESVETAERWLALAIKKYPGPALDDAASVGYPEWLTGRITDR